MFCPQGGPPQKTRGGPGMGWRVLYNAWLCQINTSSLDAFTHRNKCTSQGVGQSVCEGDYGIPGDSRWCGCIPAGLCPCLKGFVCLCVLSHSD